MISFWEFLTDLTNPALAFLPKALLVSVASAAVCAIVGVHVVLRGMAFVGDAVSHAVFPGLAVAFALQGSLLVGGAVAGLSVAALVAVFSQNRAVKEDAVIGVFFAAAFALGLVIISRVPGYTGSLQGFLFGSLTGIANSDLLVALLAGAGIVLVALAAHRALVATTLDRESARVAGIWVLGVDLLLYLLVAGAVIISVRTIGNILVLALLITPPATARLLSDRLGVIMVVAPLLGAGGALIGTYLSWAADLPAGAAIVLVVSACFLAAWAYTQGRALWRTRRAASPAPATIATATPQPSPDLSTQYTLSTPPTQLLAQPPGCCP